MLRIYHSNRLERLAVRLGALLRSPSTDWAAPEVVLVQSQGMQRWLSVALAQQLGISANLYYPFPASFIWEIYQLVLVDLPEQSGYDREPLFWRILEVLQRVPAEDARLQSLRQFLAPSDAWERAELAARLADLLDRYQVFRADWINTWDQQQGDHWQAWLWCQLVASGGEHRVSLHQRCLAQLASLEQAPAGLPARITIFGIAALPPLYLQVFEAIARFTEVHLFLLNPCEGYWGLIQAEGDIAKRYGDDPETLDDSYLETGNRLLASLGRLGRDTHHLLSEIDSSPEELFEAPGEDSLLHCLQSDILHLQNRGDNRREGELQGPALTALHGDDISIRIHVCHTPMREVEVLHDRLLALLAELPGLSAADIVVMTPDIETYAPAIRAVFATNEPYIPFSLADRRPASRSPLVEAFLGILDLCESRFPVDRVVKLLECAPLRARFGLNEADLGTIAGWLRDLAVRWGVDAKRRAVLDLPATDEHTWWAGLQRLLLGFALPAEERRLYRDILPFDAVEGDTARVMGRLVRFLRTLVRDCEALREARPPALWRDTLLQLLESFFSEDQESSEAELELLRSVLELLAESASGVDYTKPLALDGLRYWLQAHLGEAGGEGFLGGGVTFCTLMPMRSVPFRVVCLIGMNDGSFPRPHGSVDIDLMAQSPRRGDRTRRWEDRYLFLEALLSAREVFYLSYVGASVRDNKPIPPAVLLSELQDYIQQGFRTADGADALQQIRVEHPLQAFSAGYFGDDPERFSYAGFLCEALRQRGSAQAPIRWRSALCEPDPLWREVDVERLVAFFSHPGRYLLRDRLAVRIPAQEPPPQPREPFTLEDWVDTRIRQRILDAREFGESAGQLLPRVRAAGLLPHGTPGEVLYWREAGILQPLIRALEQAPAALPEAPTVALALGPYRLSGWLQGVTLEGRLGYGVWQLNARQRLDMWIRHLLLNCLEPPGVVPMSRWLGLGGPGWQLRPVSNADELLGDLLAIYWEGLQRPLPVFPRSGLAWLEGGENGLEKARQRWQGNQQVPGESADFYNRLLYGSDDPIGEEFASLAARIWIPMDNHTRND